MKKRGSGNCIYTAGQRSRRKDGDGIYDERQKGSRKKAERAKHTAFDLIIAVSNQGHTEDVMQAAEKPEQARNCNSCKGNRKPVQRKVLWITLSEEKKRLFSLSGKNRNAMQ